MIPITLSIFMNTTSCILPFLTFLTCYNNCTSYCCCALCTTTIHTQYLSLFPVVFLNTHLQHYCILHILSYSISAQGERKWNRKPYALLLHKRTPRKYDETFIKGQTSKEVVGEQQVVELLLLSKYQKGICFYDRSSRGRSRHQRLTSYFVLLHKNWKLFQSVKVLECKIHITTYIQQYILSE